MKQTEHAHNQATRADIAGKVENQVRQNSVQTVKSSETQKEAYRYDAKEGGNGKYEGRQGDRKKEKKSEGGAIRNMARPGGFDVRI